MKKAIPIILFPIISFTIYGCSIISFIKYGFSISDEKSANVKVTYVSNTDTKSETVLITINGEMRPLQHGEKETWHISWTEEKTHEVLITAKIVGHPDPYSFKITLRGGRTRPLIISSSMFVG